MPLTKQLLQQSWRFVRLFAAAFVAQLYLLPSSKLDGKLIVAAAVGAAEALYRQLSPAGSARVLGALASLMSSLASAASQKPSAAPGASQPAKTTPSPSSVGAVTPNEARQAQGLVSGLGQGGILKPAITLVGEASSIAKEVSAVVSEAPTGPDGRPYAA